MDFTHRQLVEIAEAWLKRVGCKVTFAEFVASTVTGEIPDAIGWRSGRSILVEVKVSRADFQCDKKKVFRMDPSQGMGDWRLYLCPPDVIRPDDLPEGWGLLYADGKRVRKIAGIPGGNTHWWEAPFRGNKHTENAMLVSALRRLELRGVFPLVYESIDEFRDRKPSSSHPETQTNG